MLVQGYVTVRPFGGLSIPVPVQNLVLRNYVAQMNAAYVLPLNEHKFENCFMQLFTLINVAETDAHIAMCSSKMLPRNKKIRIALFELIKIKSLKVHFVFENKILSDANDIKVFENASLLENEVHNASQQSLLVEKDLAEYLNGGS